MAKKYIYKVYRNNVYVGNLPRWRIASDFEYSQDINTAAIQVVIEVATTLDDTGLTVDSAALITGLGENIAANGAPDSGGRLLISKEYVFAGIPMDLNNRIEAWLYYESEVNGVCVFKGNITSWKTDFKTNNMRITCISSGIRLDNRLIETASNTAVVSQLVSDAETTQYALDALDLTKAFNFKQTFQVASPTTISAIRIKQRVDAASPVTPLPYVVSLRSGDQTNSFGPNLAYITRTFSNTSMEWVEYALTAPVDLVASTTYHFQMFINGAGSTAGPVYLATASTAPYANGKLYVESPSGSNTWNDLGLDLAFQLISSSGGGNIGGDYESRDPGLILRDLMSVFNQKEEFPTYTTSSIDVIGTTVSYDFKFDTVLEGVKKCLELAPANWYWYVDIGTGLLHFHRRGSSANHTFRVGKHIENVQMEYTLDDMVNLDYLSGGDTGGGVNLLTVDNSLASQSKYGVWLGQQNDVRVTREDTAHIIAQGNIQQFSSPVHRTTITILSEVYDIETIHLGQIAGFDGASDFINGIQLQIVGIDKKSDMATLYLQTMPPTVSHRIEDIKRNLNTVVTANNPSTATT